MRISDWSSDVCSSDLDLIRQLEEESKKPGAVARNEGDAEKALAGAAHRLEAIYQVPFLAHAAMEPMNCTVHVQKDSRSEERRVGKESVSTCRSRWSTYH